MTKFFHVLMISLFLSSFAQGQAPDPTFTATSTGPTTFSLVWTRPAGTFVGYRISFRLGNSGSYTTVSPLISNPATLTTTVTNVAFTPGNGYQFRLETYTGTPGSEVFTPVALAFGFTPPTAPSSVAAAQVPQTTNLRVTWTDNATNESGFQLEYDLNSSGTFIKFPTNLAENTTSQTLTNLTTDRNYRFRVRSFVVNTTVTPRDTIFSPYSTISSAVTLVGRPVAPAGIVGRQSPGTNFLIFDWTDQSTNENGFEVQLSSNNGATFFVSIFRPAFNPPNIVTTNEIPGLPTGTSFVARVRSFRVNTNLTPRDTLFSDFSALSQPVFHAPKLQGPKNLRFNFLENFDRIELVWDDLDLFEDKYEVEVSTVSGEGPFNKFDRNVPANTGSTGRYIMTGLLEAQSYWVRMVSANTAGFSSVSNTISFQTLPSRPIAPTNLRVVDSTLSTIELAWVDNAKNEESIILERSLDGQNWQVFRTLPANTQAFKDESLPNGTRYFYRLRAQNRGGFSPYTPALNAFTRKLVAPFGPTNLQVEVLSDTEVKLTWVNSPFQDFFYFTNVRLRNRIEAFIPNLKVLDIVVDKDENSIIIPRLTPTFSYTFRVLAENDAGFGGTGFFTVTMFGPPKAPENLTFGRLSNDLGDNYLAFQWEDKSDDEESFVVLLGNSANDLKDLARIRPNQTRFFHFPHDEGQSLFYAVVAQNKWGRSANTVPLRIDIPYTRAPLAPNALKGVVTSDGISLTWYDNSIREESMEVFRSSNNGTSFERVAVLPRNTASFLDAGVTMGVTYLYRVRAVNPLGASDFTNTVTVDNRQVRGQLPSEFATVYPNPTADWVTIQSEKGLNLAMARVVVTQESGKIWLSQVIPANLDTYALDLRGLPSGLYSVVIQTGQGSVSKKILKQ